METDPDEKLLPVRREVPLPGRQRTAAVRGGAMERLARATIALAQVAPRLNELALARQAEAEREAERAKDVAGLASRMGEALTETVSSLHSTSSEVGELTGSIRRIASQTSLIAVNASIAAAHAGADGRAFSVLANEIKSLSVETDSAAGSVESKIARLRSSAERTAEVVGMGVRGSGRADAVGLARLLDRMRESEESATAQAEEAGELATLAIRLRELADEMIGAVGAFRLGAHGRAEAVMEELRLDPLLVRGEKAHQERALRSAIDRNSFIELAYATDARGLQVTQNVAPGDFLARYGNSGVGRDWSRRPWFRGALATDGVFASDVYRSAATDEFCLTISASYGEGPQPAGVVAVDVNFRQLLGA